MIFNRQLRELPYFQTNPIWKLGEQVSLIFYTVPFGLNQNLKFYAINNWATGLDEYHDILNTPEQKHGNTSGCSPLVAFWMRFGTHWDAASTKHMQISFPSNPGNQSNTTTIVPGRSLQNGPDWASLCPINVDSEAFQVGPGFPLSNNPYPCMEYLPTFVRTKSPSYVGKYTIHGSMEHMGNVQVMHSYAIFSGCPPLVRPLSMCGASLRRKVAILAVCNSKAVQNQLYMGGVQKWGIPPKWMLYNRKSYL
jgi:hypothetical protein